MPLRVHNTQMHLTRETLDLLQEKGYEVSHGNWDEKSESEMCDNISGVDAVIAGGEIYSAAVFDAADQLKIVARSGSGYDMVDVNAASRLGIWVTNTPGDNGPAPAVAEYTVGLILSLLRNIHGMAMDMKNGRWEKYQGRELGNVVLGILGTGSIGRNVIKMVSGFGTKILAYDIHPSNTFATEWHFEYVTLDDLLTRSDIITIHTSLSSSTKSLINKNRLDRMKHSSYLVNTSRAQVVDKLALLEALRANRIAGAALDVHDPVPCAPDDPMVLLENVLPTPHSGYNTTESIARMSMTAAKEVVCVLSGERPKYPVNSPKKGKL